MNFLKIHILGAAAILIFSGCGSSTPFSRGKTTSLGKADAQGKPETDTPTPTPVISDDNCVNVPNSSKKVCESEFKRYIAGAAQDSCTDCHDNKTPDYNSALALIEVGNPLKSTLFLMATGQGNITNTKKHKAVWKSGDQSYKNLEDWIKGK